MAELKAPARPRSPVATTRRCTWSRPVPANNFGAASVPATATAMLRNTLSMRSAKGRAASAAACARRSFDAATICMALVIFCVALVEARRTRMSLRLAIQSIPVNAGASITSSEGLGVSVDHALQLLLGIAGKVVGLANILEDVAVLGPHQRQQAVLERAHPVDRDRIEIAVHAGIDHHDLLFHLQRRELRLL